MFEQPPDSVVVYRPDGTWMPSQYDRLLREAEAGWFVEADDEISIERAMQLMSKISEAARRQGATSVTPPIAHVETPKVVKSPATSGGNTAKQPVGGVPPAQKPGRWRRRITVGAVIFVAAWIILIYKAIHSHDNDKPIIHPIGWGGIPALSTATAVEPVAIHPDRVATLNSGQRVAVRRE